MTPAELLAALAPWLRQVEAQLATLAQRCPPRGPCAACRFFVPDPPDPAAPAWGRCDRPGHPRARCQPLALPDPAAPTAPPPAAILTVHPAFSCYHWEPRS